MPEGSHRFPKRARILKSPGFRRVYDKGFKFTGPLFSAFCLRLDDDSPEEGGRVGLTTPRAIGNAVVRNRIKRRLREAVRLDLEQLGKRWLVVINPRQRLLEAPFPELQREIRRLFLRCGN